MQFRVRLRDNFAVNHLSMSQSNQKPQTSTPLRGCVTSPGSSHPDEGIVDGGSVSHDASTAHEESSVREGRDRRIRAERERTQLSNLNHRWGKKCDFFRDSLLALVF